MAVKDFMTRKVVYVSPDTKVAHAADMMREEGICRMPVIENDQLVGIDRKNDGRSESVKSNVFIYL